MNTDQNFKAYKRDDLKLVYKIKLENQENYNKKQIMTKNLKLDKNNQYGLAMMKLMPIGCIKENKHPPCLKFNLLLETVDLDDPIGHPFVVEIFFEEENATEKQYLYNEIFPPIIEKKRKTLDANEQSTYQLLELFNKTIDKPKSYRCTARSHGTMFPKQFIPLYLEDLRFLIKRCSWEMTKIYSSFTFEQSHF